MTNTGLRCYPCVMDKIYISADDLLIDSFKLAQQIFESGFRPQFIVGVWRGGAPVGIAVQEYLDFAGIKTDHIAIRTSSYYGIGLQDKEVRVHGLNYIIDNVNATDELLLVDDVFDSGRSLIAVIKELEEKTRANLPKTIKIATPWYKPNRNTTSIVPDFFIHETDSWLVFPGSTREDRLAVPVSTASSCLETAVALRVVAASN